MYIKIAELEMTTNEKLYGSLLDNMEEQGYLVIEDPLSDKYIIAKLINKEDNND